MSAEAWDTVSSPIRLGLPHDSEVAADLEGGRGRFARRHPAITYLLIPIPLLLLLWVVYGAGLVGILSGFASYKETRWAVQLAAVLIHGIAYVPPVVLTLMIARVAIRSGTRFVWWIAAAVLVAVVSGMLMVSLNMPTTPGSGRLQVGLGFPPALSHWPQMLVPLALTALLIASRVRRRNSGQLTASS